MAHTPDHVHAALSAVAGRLRRRWFARLATRLIGTAIFGTAAGWLALLALSAAGLDLHRGVDLALIAIAALAAVAVHTRRYPESIRPPALAEAALLAETTPAASGATPLALLQPTLPGVTDPAMGALKQLDQQSWSPAVPLAARLWLIGAVALLAITVAVDMSLAPLGSPNSQSSTNVATSGKLPAVPSNTSQDLTAAALAGLRNHLMLSSADQRAEAAERYAALWDSASRAATPENTSSDASNQSTTSPTTKAAATRLEQLAFHSSNSAGSAPELEMAAAHARNLLAQRPPVDADASEIRDWNRTANHLLDQVSRAASSVGDAARSSVASSTPSRNPVNAIENGESGGSVGGSSGTAGRTDLASSSAGRVIVIPHVNNSYRPTTRSAARSRATAVAARYLSALESE